MTTTYERAAQIIAETLKVHPSMSGAHIAAMYIANQILEALMAKRIVPVVMRASADMFTRWHAHCRYLGDATEYGYKYWYDAAIAYAVEQDEWPVKVIEKTITIDGHDMTFDIQVPQSTRQATNKQLCMAYTVITDGAKEHKVILPEHMGMFG